MAEDTDDGVAIRVIVVERQKWVSLADYEALRAFAFGDAPEWVKANATLKHRVRELEAIVAGYEERDENRRQDALERLD